MVYLNKLQPVNQSINQSINQSVFAFISCLFFCLYSLYCISDWLHFYMWDIVYNTIGKKEINNDNDLKIYTYGGTILSD